uniref:recombination directionality factor n=1 Tax=Oceanithermus sp. TaxID=2268145 RepID=UPI00257CAC85
YFFLARWGGDDIENAAPQIYFPDGFGVYRLRFTSRNSLRNLLATIRELQGLTAGRIAGVPLELRLVYREVADPTGARRKVPVWTFTLKPPGQLALTNETFRVIVQRGLEAGESLKLEALEPPKETLEDMEQAMLRGELLEEPVPVEAALRPEPKAAAMDAEFERLGREPEQPAVLEPDEDALEKLGTGYVPETWTRNWFAAVEGTPYRGDAARAWLIAHVTDGRYDSLAAVIEAGEEAAQQVYNATLEAVERWRTLTANIRAIAEEHAINKAAALECLKEGQPYELPLLERCLEQLESLKRTHAEVDDAEQPPLLDG